MLVTYEPSLAVVAAIGLSSRVRVSLLLARGLPSLLSLPVAVMLSPTNTDAGLMLRLSSVGISSVICIYLSVRRCWRLWSMSISSLSRSILSSRRARACLTWLAAGLAKTPNWLFRVSVAISKSSSRELASWISTSALSSLCLAS